MQFSRTSSAPPMAINNMNSRTKSRSNKENTGTVTSSNVSTNQSRAPNSGLKPPTAISKLTGYSAATASSRQKKFAASLNTTEQLANGSINQSNPPSKRSSATEDETISPSNQSSNQSTNQSNNLFHDSSASTLAAIPATPIIRRSRLTMGDFTNQSNNQAVNEREAYVSEQSASIESIHESISSLYDAQFDADAVQAVKPPKVTKEVKTLAQKREEEATKKKLINQTISGFKQRKQQTLEIAQKIDQTVKADQRGNLTRIFDLTQKNYQSTNQIKQLNASIKQLTDEKQAIIADLQSASSDREKLDIVVNQSIKEKEALQKTIDEATQEIDQLNQQIEELQAEKDEMKNTLISQESCLINQSNKLSTLKREFDELTQSNNQSINELSVLRSEIADLEDLRSNLLKSIEKQKSEIIKKDQSINQFEITVMTQQQSINQLTNEIEKLNQSVKQSEFETTMMRKSKDDEIKQLNQSISQLNDELTHSINQSNYAEKTSSKLLIDINQLRTQLLAQKEQLTIEQSSNQSISQDYQLQSLELKSKIDQLQSINQSVNQERKMAEEERAAWAEERAIKQSKIEELNALNNQSIKEISRLTEQIDQLNIQIEQLTNQSINQCEQIDALKTDVSSLHAQIEDLKNVNAQKDELIKEKDEKLNQSINQSQKYQSMYSEQLTEFNQFKRYAGVSDTDQLQNLVKLSVEAETLRAELSEKLRLINDQSINQFSLQDRLTQTERDLTAIQTKYHASEKSRRDLHNTIQELKGNIRVFVRVKPLDKEGNQSIDQSINQSITHSINCVECVDSKKMKLLSDSPHTFSFDHIYDQSTNQTQVFDEVSSFIQSALDGYHVCLFSYGQTSSGKTHTMSGSLTGEHAGIIPRAVTQILQQARSLSIDGWKYTLEATFLEIYNENVRDLLVNKTSHSSSNQSINQSSIGDENLEIKRDSLGRTVVPGSVKVPIVCEQDVVDLLRLSSKNRSCASTKMNDRSSRSHSVFTLFLSGMNLSSQNQLCGTLNLVDLAGSERLSKSQVEGARLKETQNINRSLSALSDVFTHLNNQSKHVPFRNSKLTYLLQPCLQGDGKTLMIVNISSDASNQNETLCSLRFAAQVNQCEVGKPKKSVKTIQPVNQSNEETVVVSDPEHCRTNSGSSINQFMTKKVTSRPTSSMSRR